VFQAQPFFKPPLYAYLLSFLYRLGFGLGGVLALQMIVGSLTCALTLAVGRTLLTTRQAFAAALATALLPILPFFETQLLAETWTLALTLAAILPVLLVVSGRSRPGRRNFAVAGFLLGLAALGRPNLLLQLVVLVGCLWWWGRAGGRLRLAALMPLVLGFAVAIAPATLHNLKYGEFTLVSANLGVNLYTGQSDFADGVSAIPVGIVWDDIQLRTQQAVGRGPAAGSRFLTAETLRWMRTHPGRTLALWGHKLVMMFNAVEGRNNINPLWLARRDGVFVLARWWPATWLLLPFAVVGLIWAGRGQAPFWLLRWLVLSQAVAILPFFVNARFRAPLLPFLALFGVAGFVLLGQAVRQRRWLPLLVLVVTAIGVNVDWYGYGQEHWLARDQFNQGLIQARAYGTRKPDPTQAEAHFRRALELGPNDADANETYGALLLGQAQAQMKQAERAAAAGRAIEAEAARANATQLLGRSESLHRAATRIFPRSYRSWGNLGTCQMWQAELEAVRAGAELEAGRAAEAVPLVLAALNHYQEASASLQNGLRVNRNQIEVQGQMNQIFAAVLALPSLDPSIERVQEQLRQRLAGEK
jgi:tetratricopeptide (TPR) repeat protein